MVPTLDYLAGFFDGEGSIAITQKGVRYFVGGQERRGIYLFCGCAQKIVTPLYDFRDRWGGTIRDAGNCYHWYISGAGNAGHFLEEIYPYLRVKKSQAWFGLRFLRQCKHGSGSRFSEKDYTKRQAYSRLMSRFNRRKKM